ncbi:MAG: MFS transporter [Rhodobacteraceae bacterium]|nr:MFS transporter [Paracoccaceae bacterium]
MLQVLHSSWALLLGMMLLMVGNGVQGTLLGIRGALEGFSTFELSLVMSGYFAGFLGGSRIAPWMIRRVGHVRVFAALGSFISAVLILYPALTDPWIWIALRVAIGFCFSGVYVTAESWLNNAASNENRGKALSLYMIVQMVGIVAAQGLVVLGDPSGFLLFIVPSVLVSVAFAPILLSISPTPGFDTTKGLSLIELYHISPLGCVGIFILGGTFAALFGMAAVFGTEAGLTVPQISAFVSMIFFGGLMLQFPIGWISDRMDRRVLILIVSGLGVVVALMPVFLPGNFIALLAAAFFLGGLTNPLYALLIAYVNDFLDVDDMAAASSGLVFISGVGAIAGPVVTGLVMAVAGPYGFFLYVAILLAALLVYGAWRATQRAAPDLEEQGAYVTLPPSGSLVAVDMAQEVYVDAAQEGNDAT